MFENFDINKTLQTLIGLYVLSIGHQFYQGYKMAGIDERIKRQLEGVFDEKAQALLEPVEERIGLAESKIASETQLRAEADRTLEKYSEETQTNIRNFMQNTDARITSISKTVGTLNTTLRGLKVRRPSKVKTPPPKRDWKGVTTKDLKTCRDHYDPTKCGDFKIEVDHPEKSTKGKPIISFMTPNFWTQPFNVDLRLDYHIDVIGFGEKDGVAENRSVLFQIGYYRGDKFYPLEDFSIGKGDHRGLDKHLFLPRVTPTSADLEWYQTSFLAGAVFSPISVSGNSIDFRTGLSLNVGMLNFRGGEIRLGANAVLSQDVLGGGLFGSYHMKLFNRKLNIAPTIGVLYDSQFRSALQVGLISEVW